MSLTALKAVAINLEHSHASEQSVKIYFHDPTGDLMEKKFQPPDIQSHTDVRQPVGPGSFDQRKVLLYI